MKQDFGPKRIIAFILAIVLTVFVVIGLSFYFLKLSTIAPDYQQIRLRPQENQSESWQFQVGDQQVSSIHWDEYGNFVSISGSEPAPITAKYILTEKIHNAMLQFSVAETGIQVFLDDRLLYTDYPDKENRLNTLLSLNEKEETQFFSLFRSLFVPLPDDYLGKTLTIITYSPTNDAYGLIPCFPTLCNTESFAASFVSDSIWPILLGTIAAIASILLLVLYLVSLWNASPDHSILLLALFSFLCIFVVMGNSVPESFSFGDALGAMNALIKYIFVDVLLLFFASKMLKPFNLLLMGATVVHLLLQTVQMMIHLQQGWSNFFFRDPSSFFLILLSILFMLLQYRKQPMFRQMLWSLIPGGILFLSGILLQYLGKDNIIGIDWMAVVRSNDYYQITFLLSTYLALVSTAVLFVLAIKNRIHKDLELQGLTLKSLMAEENFILMQDSVHQAGIARHELNHHIAALNTMLEHQNCDQAKEYLKNLTEQTSQLVKAQFCNNFLINTILSYEFSRAKEKKIRIEELVSVPEKLPFLDTDLTTLLMNLLENAIYASSKCSDPNGRWIRLKIYCSDTGLLISCTNSMTGELCMDEQGNFLSTQKDTAGHGYGLFAMKQVAEKYNSVLLIEHDEHTFTVKTNLALPSHE